NSSFCEAAFDIVGPWPKDQNAGTHYYLYNNYTWNDNAGTGCNVFDSEAFMFDTWDAHPGNNNTGVIANNISWSAKRYCVHFFTGGTSNSITPTMKAYNNTCFHNNVATAADSADGELNISVGLPWAMRMYKNIALSPNPTSSGGNQIYA